MTTNTLTAPLGRYSGEFVGQTAIDKAGRDLGTITKVSRQFIYTEDGSRIAFHNTLRNPWSDAKTLYEFPDGSHRLSTLEEWLAAA